MNGAGRGDDEQRAGFRMFLRKPIDSHQLAAGGQGRRSRQQFGAEAIGVNGLPIHFLPRFRLALT